MKLLTGYSPAPLNAWAGWRLRIPGGPLGGQYKGFLAADDLTDDAGGWPAGHDEIFRPIDNRGGLGIYPWQAWDTGWAGSPLMEGQTVSDMVYRSPAELRPRPNASGGINVVNAVQLERRPGYAMSPGNYKALGAVNPSVVMSYPPVEIIPGPGGGSGGSGMRVCPAWGCGPPPWTRGYPVTPVIPPYSPAPAPSTPQPPPPVTPQPAPVVPIGPAGSSGCAAGQYRDAAGNCTSDWRNPYSMYLPLDNQAQPAPYVPANTCPTGYSVDPNGNCVTPGTCPAGYSVDTSGNCIPPASSGVMAWLESSTSVAGMNIPNFLIAGIGVFAAVRLMRGRR